MLVQEVAKKYAKALFLATKDKGLIDQAYEQITDLGKLIKGDKLLLNFLGAPQVLDEHKEKLVRDVFGPRLEQLFVEFLIVVLDKNRVMQLPAIIDEFNRLVEASKGIGRATVITAVAIDDTQRSKLTAQLSSKTNLRIVLEEKVDPSIIGGMIVILHNQIIDGSIKHYLSAISDQLERVRVH
jgi:F-type H+-transporting ATPase subunit delta